MKTKVAIHISELLWEDTVRPNSLFDMLLQVSPALEAHRQAKEYQKIDSLLLDLRTEVVAHWANIIMEHEHDTIR